MSEFGGKIERNITEGNTSEIQSKPETQEIFNDLFKDDFEGIDDMDLGETEVMSYETELTEDFDSQKVFEELFADDFEGAGDFENIENKDEAEALEDTDNKPSEETGENADNEGDNGAEGESEYDENGTRELTPDEKQRLKDVLGWSEKKINDCRIDENGVIHLKTDCQDKEGTTSENGVAYERKRFEYKGIKFEGVFPVFDSAFDTKLDESDYHSSSVKQFNKCNQKLKEAIENNPDLRKKFTDEQLEDIENGRTPRGYTWHHNEEPGKMQLVKTEDHDRRIGGAAHTGGNSIWGNASVDKSNDGSEQKGEAF